MFGWSPCEPGGPSERRGSEEGGVIMTWWGTLAGLRMEKRLRIRARDSCRTDDLEGSRGQTRWCVCVWGGVLQHKEPGGGGGARLALE